MAKRFRYDFYYRSRQRLFTAFLAASTSLLGLGLIFALSTGFLGSAATKTDPLYSRAQNVVTKAQYLVDLIVRDITKDSTDYHIVVCNNTTYYPNPSPVPETRFAVKLTNLSTGQTYTSNKIYQVPAGGRCFSSAGIPCSFFGSTCMDSVSLEAFVESAYDVPEINEANNLLVKTF